MPLEGVRMINHLKSKILITGCNFCYLRSPLVSRKEKIYIYILQVILLLKKMGGVRGETGGPQHPGWRGRPCLGEGVGVRGWRGGGGVICSPSDIFEGCWLRAFAALNHALAQSVPEQADGLCSASPGTAPPPPAARGLCGRSQRR